MRAAILTAPDSVPLCAEFPDPEPLPGHDLLELVAWCSFEDVGRLLWTGRIEPDGAGVDPVDLDAARRAVEHLTAALPAASAVTARLSAGAIAASPWVPFCVAIPTWGVFRSA